MKVLDLFSGIGGFSLGLELASPEFETVGFCEFDEKARRVLELRWPGVPIYKDIRELQPHDIEPNISVFSGGYPCQPFSVAGQQRGEEDDRHLWPEMYRLIKAVRPRWIIAENVAGHITMGLDTVLSELESIDYTWWTFVIPACAVDARHRRDRVWIVAHAQRDGLPGPQERGSAEETTGQEPPGEDDPQYPAGASRLPGAGGNVADTPGGRCEQHGRAQSDEPAPEWGAQEPELCGSAVPDAGSSRGQAGLPGQGVGEEGFPGEPDHGSDEGRGEGAGGGMVRWPTEPAVGRVAHGVPGRVDRLRQLGNSVVPQVVAEIGRAILAHENG